MAQRSKPATLRPVLPNAGVESAYRRKLKALVRDLHDRISAALLQAYAAEEPAILAQDKTPRQRLLDALNGSFTEWLGELGDLPDALAREFVTGTNNATRSAFRSSLRQAGFTVGMYITPRTEKKLGELVGRQVGLISSIPGEYHRHVVDLVTESVRRGRDQHYLRTELQRLYGLSERRAVFIARDQTNKATESISRLQSEEAGITEGVWVHLSAAKKPRPEHVAMNGKTFKLNKGLYDPVAKKYVLPGELYNCHCTYRPVIPANWLRNREQRKRAA